MGKIRTLIKGFRVRAHLADVLYLHSLFREETVANGEIDTTDDPCCRRVEKPVKIRVYPPDDRIVDGEDSDISSGDTIPHIRERLHARDTRYIETEPLGDDAARLVAIRTRPTLVEYSTCGLRCV